MKKIFGELSRIQQELKAPKNLYNSFGKYSYRNAEGILEALKPLLNGLVLIINDEPVMIGERYYIKATATLTDGDESVSSVAYAREDEEKKGMDGCQITGSCSSYARKYALNALLMIDDSKDSDDDSLSPKNPQNAPEKVRNDKPAEVTTAKTLPGKTANPVFTYIGNEQAFMAQRLGITTAQMKIQFADWRKKLIKSGAVEDIAPAELTMDQAKNLVEAVYVTFMTDKGDAK